MEQIYIPGMSPSSRQHRMRGRKCKRRAPKTVVVIPEVDRAAVEVLKSLARKANLSYAAYCRRILLAHLDLVSKPTSRL